MLTGLLLRAAAAPVEIASLDTAPALAALQARPSVFVADLAKGERGVLFTAPPAQPLPPGRYRVHVPVAAAPLGTLAVGLLRLELRAGEATRTVTAVQFPAADEYAVITLDFVQARAGAPELSLAWRAEETPKSKGLLGKRALELQQAAGATAPALTGLGEDDAPVDDLKLEDEAADRPRTEALRLPCHLVSPGALIERRSPLAATVHTDKLVYRPGDRGTVRLGVRNCGDAPVQAQLTAELVTGLQAPAPLQTATLDLAPGAARELTWADVLDTAALRWGAEVRVRFRVAGFPDEDARAVLAVSDNLWESAIIAAHPAHLAAFDAPAAAQAAAARLREQGFTGFEAFFWAPCDLLEFTPDEELFFSGQTGYPGTRTGTRNLIEACHAQGLGATFYANLWGGSGPPAFEVMRRHPEWFGNANYNTFVLDDWELLGPSQMDMGERKVRAPGIATWCFNQLNVVPPEGVFRYHAAEISGSAERFGWDGIRYDSYYSRYWSVRAMRLIRGLVEAARPGFAFGYNSFAEADARALALDDMIGGGGMIMGEGIRIERTQNLHAFAREVLAWRDLIWGYGGHGPGLIWRDSTDEEEMTPAGIEYQAAILLGGGGHPYYNAIPSERADYPHFALRYGEFLWDNRLRALATPAQVIAVEGGGPLLEWQEFARARTLEGNRHRLVLQLIPDPGKLNPFKDKAMPLPPPVRDLAVRLALPTGAQVTGAWLLHADPEPGHEALVPVAADGGAVRLTIPPFRFWRTLVVEFTAERGLALRTTVKEKTDSWLQDWYVLGPFPNTLEMDAVKTAFAPEQGVDLTAPCKTPDGRDLRWRRTGQPGAPPTGRLPLDFRDALDLHDGAPGCAYAYTEIVADRDRDVVLMGKADDTLALWVNGQPVTFTGGTGEFQDVAEGRAPVRLRAGRNTVLAKVCEKWLYWLLALRVADADGEPLREGLQFGCGNP